jgi:putative ABC transport system substrate-binding protein
VAVVGMGDVVAAGGVAVIMSADVDAYREALRGFKAVIQQSVVAERDMEGNIERGKSILAEFQAQVKPDLILAMGVWALQAVSPQVRETPVVYAMVLNPPNVVAPDAKNVTGASMNVPLDESIRLFRAVDPRIRRLGVVFNRAKTGYLVRPAEALAEKEGLRLVSREVGSPRDVVPALDALRAAGMDAVWMLPDEVVLAQPVVQQMVLFSYREKVSLLGFHATQARAGALLSLAMASNEDIGRQAGELAMRILQGKHPSELPYTTARKLQLILNLKAAKRLDLSVSKKALEAAGGSQRVPLDVTVIE